MNSNRASLGVTLALAALLGVVGAMGCGSGGGGGQGAALAKADSVDVTYYYLPG
jgi:hypothetical protein